jgi:hypothetical protein
MPDDNPQSTRPPAAAGRTATKQAGATAAKNEQAEPRQRASWKTAVVMILIWLGMLGLGAIGLRYGVDEKLVAGGFLLVGLASSAFAWLIGLIAAVPLFGPLVIKVLAIPFIWLLNAIGYLISIVAIRRGYSKDVLTYRGLTIALIIGITIGFIIGRLV